METEHGMPLKALVEQAGLEVLNASTDFDKKLITTAVINRPGLQLTGFYTNFTTERLQILGWNEDAYLQQFSEEERRAKLDKLMAAGVPAIIIAHDVNIPEGTLDSARENNITILKSHRETSELIIELTTKLNNALAPQIMRHGVFLEVYSEGVLILGESGMGKSETAIELIKRGHHLISDDAVIIKKVNSTTLTGTAPDLIRNYIELRGIGVVDVRRIFGNGAVKWSEKVDLVIKLENWDAENSYDRMGSETNYIDILGVKVPYIVLPIRPGRNLAVIIEVAAMNNRQKRMGLNSGKDFAEQLDDYFDSLEST